MKKPGYLIGIDLGTTHTVVAYAKLEKDLKKVTPRLFEIEQLIAPGVVAKRPMLPSFRYHPAPDEINPDQLCLPWESSELPGEIDTVVIGELARELGSKVEGRLVVSAKSWLSHSQVDRSDAILPWGAHEDVEKVSPVLASASYLNYIKDAWNAEHPDDLLQDQEITITIPASFDEAARTLTLEAAALAGLMDVLLIEEPQAVCYDWFHRNKDKATELLSGTQLLLVCDIGGGTSDFSLIKVSEKDGQLELERVGVGDHLMLGGDNIDLALAYAHQKSFLDRDKGERQLSLAAFSQLIQQARQAKEILLSEDSPGTASLTLLGGGSKLIGGTKRVEVEKSEVRQLTLEGFLPIVAPHQKPQKKSTAIVELGLPYAADPAITKHIAEFLQAHQSVCREALGIEGDSFAAPDAVLFNGGIFNSPLTEDRLRQQLEKWREGSVKVLENGHPDLAVAYGAVAYGLARRGAQLRITGGAARSYFLVVESAQRIEEGVCLLPRGTPEDTEITLEERKFVLRTGEPVKFHLASTVDDSRYEVGELAPLVPERFRKLPPLHLSLPRTRKDKEVQVRLACRLTEIGTIELSCIAVDDPSVRWQVEFEIRKHLKQQRIEGGLQFISPEDLPVNFDKAIAEFRLYYGKSNKKVDKTAVKKLRANLEKLLGRRDQWDMPTLRALFNECYAGMKRRRRTQLHERIWFNLAGYCLRPGFGYPADELRIKKIWPLYNKGLQYPGETQSWADWWTFWRRVSGGLSSQQQERIYQDIQKYLDPEALHSRKIQAELKNRSYEDILRLAASLENLHVKHKIELGDWLCQRLSRPNASETCWWALGRVGTREPFHGSTENIVPISKVYEWLSFAMEQDWKRNQNAAFCALLLARKTDDPMRDIDERFREKVLETMKQARAPHSWQVLVAEKQALEATEMRRIYGEALPSGIRLID